MESTPKHITILHGHADWRTRQPFIAGRRGPSGSVSKIRLLVQESLTLGWTLVGCSRIVPSLESSTFSCRRAYAGNMDAADR